MPVFHAQTTDLRTSLVEVIFVCFLCADKDGRRTNSSELSLLIKTAKLNLHHQIKKSKKFVLD